MIAGTIIKIKFALFWMMDFPYFGLEAQVEYPNIPSFIFTQNK